MKNSFLIIDNAFGIFSRTITIIIFYLLTLFLSTSLMIFQAPQENAVMQDPSKAKALEKLADSLWAIF